MRAFYVNPKKKSDGSVWLAIGKDEHDFPTVPEPCGRWRRGKRIAECRVLIFDF
jgi:hypothetical protein